MAIHDTLANKTAAFKPYPDPDLNGNKGKGSGTHDTAFWSNTIKGHISGAPAQYTKAWYFGLSKCSRWVLFFYIEVISSLYPAYIQNVT